MPTPTERVAAMFFAAPNLSVADAIVRTARAEGVRVGRFGGGAVAGILSNIVGRLAR